MRLSRGLLWKLLSSGMWRRAGSSFPKTQATGFPQAYVTSIRLHVITSLNCSHRTWVISSLGSESLSVAEKSLICVTFFLSYSDLFLPTHGRCRGLFFAPYHTQWHTHTHTHTHTQPLSLSLSVGLLWTRDRPGAETSKVSKVWVCCRSLAGTTSSNPAPGTLTSVCCVACCKVEVSASGWSLVQRSPTECGVYECDREASVMRRPWCTRGCCAMGGGDRL
jgi:hypothetical protein